MIETHDQMLWMVLQSALLWSGFALLVVCVARKRTAARWPRRAANIALAVALYQFACSLWVFIVPISGSVLDAETAEPFVGTPVYSRWVGLAPSWENWCWAAQRTLTDANGEFSFRLPPVSTLLPVFERGTSVSMPGRITQSDSGYWLFPVISSFQMKRFEPEHAIAAGTPAADCSSKRTVSRGYVRDAYLDHPDAYRKLYVDACVASNAATRTDYFFKDLADAWAHEYELTLDRPVTEWNDPRKQIVRAPGKVLHQRVNGFSTGCGRLPGVCARAIDESLARELCALVAPRPDFRSEALP